VLAQGEGGSRRSSNLGYSGSSGNQNKAHRAVAIGSMSVATISSLMMLKPFRRD
jgi:hypothetical protein